MKPSTLIFIVTIAVAAYLLGRHFERLASVQSEVGNLKMRLIKLEDRELRGEVRWGWFYWIVSRIPIVKGLLH